MFGPERLRLDLSELAYEVEVMTAQGKSFAVIKGYEVLAGRFQGRVIDLGIQAPPDYPHTVGSSIHVKAKPQLLEKSDTLPGVRNILDSALGPDWRYWSFSFGRGPHTANDLLAKINTVFRGV